MLSVNFLANPSSDAINFRIPLDVPSRITNNPLDSCSKSRESVTTDSLVSSSAFSMIRHPPSTCRIISPTFLPFNVSAWIFPTFPSIRPVSCCNTLIMDVASVVFPVPCPPKINRFPVAAVLSSSRCLDAPVSAWRSCASIPLTGIK